MISLPSVPNKELVSESVICAICAVELVSRKMICAISALKLVSWKDDLCDVCRGDGVCSAKSSAASVLQSLLCAICGVDLASGKMMCAICVPRSLPLGG